MPTPSTQADCPAKWIAGSLMVAVLIAGGRWVSHVPIGPVYISDVLLCGAALYAFLAALTRKEKTLTYGPGVLIALVILWATVRMLTPDGALRVAARDAAPFVYCSAAYLSTRACQRASVKARKRTVRLLHCALLIHAGWLAAALLTKDFASMMPVLDGEAFKLRPDFDSAMLGVIIGLSIIRIREGKVWANASVAGAALFLLLFMQTRAGLLSCCACVAAALMLRSRKGTRITVRTILLVAAAVLVMFGLLPSSPAGERLIATTGGVATSQEARSAQGTTRARLIAWQRVLDYTLDDPARTVIGVGFGPDFLRLSDGDLPLGRGIGVRSPHNYLLGCFARLGLVGLMSVTALLSVLLAVALSTLWAGRPDELTSISVLLVISILIVSMLGVVLESPFGALPFFWASGILLGMHRSRRAQRGDGLGS
ncbi:O-antigen ligase family protein [Streptomyces cellulosae]|uniref:O-antigen ligase family protein n=1 Tax=Streptomyces cellulosae TaxID=1968 RepID=A0ABW7Y4Q5_STRCE